MILGTPSAGSNNDGQLQKVYDNKQKKTKKKLSHRARHRLMSIRFDVEVFRKSINFNSKPSSSSLPPLVANERCGIWYAYPFIDKEQQNHSCYFKSTDGHTNIWNVSLKRLNLNIIQLVSETGSVIIVDSSMRKKIPDSFSRTIPIWAAVINRVAQMYRRDLDLPEPEFWDNSLHTTVGLVPEEEQEQIENLLGKRAQDLYNSKAIVDPIWLASTLQKPLKSVALSRDDGLDWQSLSLVSHTEKNAPYYTILCYNMSQVSLKGQFMEDKQFFYTPGAADDEESWSRHLSPLIFWENIISEFEGIDDDDEFDAKLDSLVRLHTGTELIDRHILADQQQSFDWIGKTGIAIGTRRAGRPPECWGNFDAILNVTDMTYEVDESDIKNRFYLQCPVKEGKKDKKELEKWLPVGIYFIWWHRKNKRSVLVHCAQGMDRSVAFVMATAVIFCELEFPLDWKASAFDMNTELIYRHVLSDKQQTFDWIGKTGTSHGTTLLYKLSGLSEQLVECLLETEGADRFLDWIHCGMAIPSTAPLASKETLRIVLHLIAQDREKACPSRATMLKLNRFFMSRQYLPNEYNGIG
jgi:tRNA A64-2'-O-ribosylphosphate transferase